MQMVSCCTKAIEAGIPYQPNWRENMAMVGSSDARQMLATATLFSAPPRTVAIRFISFRRCRTAWLWLRYWTAHGKPSALAVLRAKPGAEPVFIEFQGKDAISVNGQKVSLQRYTIANLMFGHEVLWLDAQGNLAAAMTFAGGLPLEAVRAEYEPALSDLYRKGLAQEIANLEAIGRSVPPERAGAFAITGETRVDATGAPPDDDAGAECLRYALSLPTSVVITGISDDQRLDQAFESARTFKPFSESELSTLLAKTKDAALSGKIETFKTTTNQDGTARNPQWMG